MSSFDSVLPWAGLILEVEFDPLDIEFNDSRDPFCWVEEDALVKLIFFPELLPEMKERLIESEDDGDGGVDESKRW